MKVWWLPSCHFWLNEVQSGFKLVVKRDASREDEIFRDKLLKSEWRFFKNILNLSLGDEAFVNLSIR